MFNYIEYKEMKQIYVNPKLEVIMVQMQHQMLAGSITDSTTGVKFSDTSDAVTTPGGMDGREDGFDW